MTKYPYIRAWGRMMGSFDSFIESEIADAERDNAPDKAIYKGDDGWHTWDAIEAKDTKDYIQRLVDEMK